MATKGKGAKASAAAEAQVTHVKFLGYDNSVPENERVLNQDEAYEVIEVTAEGGYVVKAPNPQFDSKKKVSDKNPEFIEAECFKEEVEVVEAPAVGEGEAAPAPVAAKASTKVKAGKAPAPAKEKVAKAPKAPKAEVAPKVEEDSLPVLTEEQEDADVWTMVSEAKSTEDLITVAQELEGDIATSEYRMGGILYHIKKDKGYQELNPAYKERGGFGAFLKDNMNVDYRKAMYLIDIYVTFSQSGLENPAEVVARIGWTKASKIVAPMQAEDANVDDLVKLAEESTVADLQEAIKEQKVHVGGTAGEAKTRVTMKFRYFEDEAVGLVEIITAVKTEQGFKSDDEAVAFIIKDWAATSGGVAEPEAAPQQAAAPAKATSKPKVSKAREAATA